MLPAGCVWASSLTPAQILAGLFVADGYVAAGALNLDMSFGAARILVQVISRWELSRHRGFGRDSWVRPLSRGGRRFGFNDSTVDPVVKGATAFRMDVHHVGRIYHVAAFCRPGRTVFIDKIYISGFNLDYQWHSS